MFHNPGQQPASNRSRALRLSHLVVMLLVVVTAFRLWFCTRLELVGDEAYYWLWSRHLDYCYLDKGPMIAWLIKAGTLLFGSTVFGVRFFAVLTAAGTGWGVFILARQLFDERTAFWSVVLTLVIPLFAVGATLMTIDTPYVFFWTWTAVVFWRARETPRLLPWVLAGLILGGGILSKYTALTELLSFALFCLWNPADRSQLKRPGFYLMVGVALLFLLPALAWNVQHGWLTTRWLTQRGGLNQTWHVHPVEVLAFLGEQAGVVSPFLFLGMLAAACWPQSHDPLPDPATRFVSCLFLPLLGFYTVLSFQRAGQANWAAAAYVGGTILLARRWQEAMLRHRWTRALAGLALAVALLETALLHGTAWLHLPGGRDPLDRARGSRSLAAALVRAQRQTGTNFVITNRYMTSALLSFYLPDQPPTYLLPSLPILNEIQTWPGYRQSHPGGDGLWVSDLEPPPLTLQADFSRIEPIGIHDAVQDGRLVKRFYFYWCHRSLPGSSDAPTRTAPGPLPTP